MRNGGELMRAASRFAIIGVIGGLTAACSSDRFASNSSLSNPFSSTPSAEPTRTGSIASEPRSGGGYGAPMPRSSIQSEPLPLVGSAPSASHAPSASQATRARTASGGPGWSTSGGTTVIVGPGETLSTLTGRYGVPGDAILSSNGLKASDITAGRRVVIPVYSATGEGGAQRRAEAPAPVRYNNPPAPSAPAPAPRVVASQKIEVTKQPPRTVAEAAPPKSQLRPGQLAAKPVPVAPAKVVAAAPAAAKPAKVAEKAPEPKAKDVVLPAKKVAKVEPAKKAEAPQKVAAAAPAAAKPAAREPETTASVAPSAPVATAAPATSSADFRWPARGRVIAGFGGGGGNEGINIAVPEGTAVKAAGDGVVAYAGNEVKGYGNLVLIRHDNGYVSAYANNGQIDVKRGQRVNRGQSIAKSGQTGNVTSPQLHFEIRKGSTPVDPMKYLASAE